MKTETNFTEPAKTFNENVAKGIAWMQDANTKLMEIQKQKMCTQFESLNKQIADLTLINQTNFDSMLKQCETRAKSFTPLMEQLKKEMETVITSSKETIQTIIKSYADFAAPAIEFEKLNKQIETGMNANIKFWSDLMTPIIPSTTETKVDNEILKIAHPNNKKHANEKVV